MIILKDLGLHEVILDKSGKPGEDNPWPRLPNSKSSLSVVGAGPCLTVG